MSISPTGNGCDGTGQNHGMRAVQKSRDWRYRWIRLDRRLTAGMGFWPLRMLFRGLVDSVAPDTPIAGYTVRLVVRGRALQKLHQSLLYYPFVVSKVYKFLVVFQHPSPIELWKRILWNIQTCVQRLGMGIRKNKSSTYEKCLVNVLQYATMSDSSSPTR